MHHCSHKKHDAIKASSIAFAVKVKNIVLWHFDEKDPEAVLLHGRCRDCGGGISRHPDIGELLRAMHLQGRGEGRA